MDSNIQKEQDDEANETTKKYCADCGQPTAIPPRVPWGQWRCKKCREFSKCILCNQSYDDCAC